MARQSSVLCLPDPCSKQIFVSLLASEVCDVLDCIVQYFLVAVLYIIFVYRFFL